MLVPGNSSSDTVCGNPGGRVNPGTTSPQLTTVTKRPPLRAGTERPTFNDQDPSADTGEQKGKKMLTFFILGRKRWFSLEQGFLSFATLRLVDCRSQNSPASIALRLPA